MSTSPLPSLFLSDGATQRGDGVWTNINVEVSTGRGAGPGCHEHYLHCGGAALQTCQLTYILEGGVVGVSGGAVGEQWGLVGVSGRVLVE